ncbi:hypothetical protein NXX56_23150 [Bacteroides thetaiotaomicron]|nr:hypothetical protein [Bacteroides thetaiotaomicron]
MNYPASEVNYEQAIVAPSVMFLLQLYMETGRQKYLDGAKIQMPVLEAFNGKQPSYHLNEIAVRHWDGYWFVSGKCGEILFHTIGVHCQELLFIFIRNVREIIHIKSVQRIL